MNAENAGRPLAAVLVLLAATGALTVWSGRGGGWRRPAKPVTIVPIAGILIGGGMRATSLAGRRACDELPA